MPTAATLGKGRTASTGAGGADPCAGGSGVFGPAAILGTRERKEEGAYLGRGWTLPPPLCSPLATPCTPGTANTAWREHPQLPSASSRLHTLPCPTVPPPPRGPAPLPRAPMASLGSPGPPTPPAAAVGSRPAPGGPGACPGPWWWVRGSLLGWEWTPLQLCWVSAGSRPPLNHPSCDLTSWPPAIGVAGGKLRDDVTATLGMASRPPVARPTHGDATGLPCAPALGTARLQPAPRCKTQPCS